MQQPVRQKRIRVVLIVVAVIALIVVLAVAFWPWLRPWLPHQRLLEAWINYLTVDLNVGRWGPVVILLLVALVELVWALILGRRSGLYERQWTRLERMHSREMEVLEQEITLLKEERRSLRAELALREDLIREEKARMWAQFDDLQRESGLLRPDGTMRWETGVAVLLSPTALSEVPDLTADVRGEWRQIISQLERIEMISSVTTQRASSAMESQQRADELLRLGAACYYLGQYERAMAHYSRAVDLAPNVPEAYINRAVVNHALTRHQPALQDLDRALKTGEQEWAYLYRGLIREEQGDRKRAMEDYTRALRVNP
ncbi:MAG TPA: tetratricopeptide repeat protein, partial [Alphaproteobacteria bacterium]|nr:tetratricopeptide repeat protein [Alphaproteobacteria bacterium]